MRAIARVAQRLGMTAAGVHADQVVQMVEAKAMAMALVEVLVAEVGAHLRARARTAAR